MKIIFIIYFIINISNIISGEYFINKSIPSYLYNKYNNIKDEIFPYDIRINISLSRIDGDLLYSIDKNYNQLIVSLSDIMVSTIKIQFRKKYYFVSLSKLCGCERCLYEILDLRIQIRELIGIQCNDREVEYFRFNKIKEINDAYPILYSKNDINNGLPNEAHMWIVNQEQYKDIYHNPLQLLGCIFNVWYNIKQLNFSKISDNVGRECREVCIADICNGGKCYETYNGVPVCDCTKTLLTGTYCNDTLTSLNVQSSLQDFQFDLLKLSWKSSSKEILHLNNSNTNINVFVVDKTLFFNYKYNNGEDTYVKGTLSRHYIPNREYILIIYFMKTAIDIQFFNNGSLFHTIIPTNIDLSNEVFTSLLLQSGDGYIGLSYKDSPREYKWYKVYIKSPIKVLNVKKNMTNDQNFNQFSFQSITFMKDNATALQKDTKKEIIIGLSVIISVLAVLLLTIPIILILIRRKSTLKNIKDSKNKLLHDEEVKSPTPYCMERIKFSKEGNKKYTATIELVEDNMATRKTSLCDKNTDVPV